MVTRSAFHLDCTPIIPECGFKCAKCLQELQSVFGEMPGVDSCYTEGEGENAKFVVEHDPSKVTIEQLVETFRRLPSFYKEFFFPRLLDP